MPDLAADGRADGDAVGLPPRSGEDSGRRTGERSADLDSLTKETGTQKTKKKSKLKSQSPHLTTSILVQTVKSSQWTFVTNYMQCPFHTLQLSKNSSLFQIFFFLNSFQKV